MNSIARPIAFCEKQVQFCRDVTAQRAHHLIFPARENPHRNRLRRSVERRPQSFSPKRGSLCLAAVFALLQVPFCAIAQDIEDQPRILLVFGDHNTLPANIRALAGAENTFRNALQDGYELFVEYRNSQRFPGEAEDRLFADELRRKYGSMHLDAVLALGRSALAYSITNRQDLGANTPVVFAGMPKGSIDAAELPEGFHGSVSAFSVAKTVALARDLQPQARRVVIFAGSSPFDLGWKARVDAALADMTGIEREFVTGLTLAEFRDRAASLDPGTILVILTIYQDAAGQVFTPLNAATQIAETSAAPTYSVIETFIGQGILGGVVEKYEDIGAGAAQLALDLMNGATDLPRIGVGPTHAMLDWRQLQRYGLDPANVPAGTETLFRELSAWERYRREILIALVIILAQSVTIAALILQARRKRAAEQEASERRLELAHVSRVSQMGELSGALAHELNQPLTSVLANAEAGIQLLAKDPPDLDEIAAILRDIAEDDRRAAAMISELRRLMSKGEVDFQVIDMTETVIAAIALVGGGLSRKGVVIEAPSASSPLPVRGNRAQMMQVVINFLFNATEAVAGQPPERQRVQVTTRLRPDGWRELSVADQGSGLPEQIGDPFRPFATTKAQGLGLGLSICRSIADAHGGTLAFDKSITRGARIVLALPAP